MNNNRRLYGLEVGCPQMTLSINDQQNNIFVNRGTILTFKVCGNPNADYIDHSISVWIVHIKEKEIDKVSRHS